MDSNWGAIICCSRTSQAIIEGIIGNKRKRLGSMRLAIYWESQPQSRARIIHSNYISEK